MNDSVDPTTDLSGENRAGDSARQSGQVVLAVPPTDQQAKNFIQRYRMRSFLFNSLLIATGLFLLNLLCLLWSLWHGKALLLAFSGVKVQALTFYAVVLTVSAAVPLSIILALVKMSSEPQVKSSDEPTSGVLATPIGEIVKAFAEACKSFKG